MFFLLIQWQHAGRTYQTQKEFLHILGCLLLKFQKLKKKTQIIPILVIDNPNETGCVCHLRTGMSRLIRKRKTKILSSKASISFAEKGDEFVRDSEFCRNSA